MTWTELSRFLSQVQQITVSLPTILTSSEMRTNSISKLMDLFNWSKMLNHHFQEHWSGKVHLILWDQMSPTNQCCPTLEYHQFHQLSFQIQSITSTDTLTLTCSPFQFLTFQALLLKTMVGLYLKYFPLSAIKDQTSVGNSLEMKRDFPRSRNCMNNTTNLLKCWRLKEPIWITSDLNIFFLSLISTCILATCLLKKRSSICHLSWKSTLDSITTFRWSHGSLCFIKFLKFMSWLEYHPKTSNNTCPICLKCLLSTSNSPTLARSQKVFFSSGVSKRSQRFCLRREDWLTLTKISKMVL